MTEFDFDDGTFKGEDHADDKSHYGFGKDNFEKAIARAMELGLTVIVGTDSALLLDLDEGMVLNEELLNTMRGFLGPITIKEWTSKGGKGKHVVLSFSDVTFTTREALLLEVVLGSDPWRGFLSLMDIRFGVKNPRTLFKPNLT